MFLKGKKSMEKNSKHTSIHQPHDKLVKRLLSSPEAAKDILSLYLPKEVLAIADLHYLEMQKDSFIDDEYRAYAVDMLYKTKFQHEEGYIWILLEHQRKSDFWMPVRIFKYIAIIWDHLRKTNQSNSIPLIYPLIIYNGARPYEHSLTMSDLIKPDQAKEIFGTLFIKPFSLIDLPAMNDDMLRKQAQDHVRGIALLMALKHASDRHIETFFVQVFANILKKLANEGGEDEVVDVLYYLLKECEFLDKNRFFKMFRAQEFSSEVENKMSTVAQQLQEEGREKGLEEGKIEVAKRLLAENINLSEKDLIAWVHRMTGLSLKKIKEIQKKH